MSIFAFLHSFIGSDTTSKIFGVGKKSVFQKIINQDRLITDCAKMFSLPHQSQNLILSKGSMAMLAIFEAKKVILFLLLDINFCARRFQIQRVS